MDKESGFDAAMALAERTLACASEYQTPPNPRNFELLYTYITGLKQDLNAAISETLAAKRRISSVDAGKLYKAHLCEEQLACKIEEVGRKLSAEIGEILGQLKSADGCASSFEASIDSDGARLREVAHAPHVETILQSLRDATARMAENNRELRTNFARSQTQIEQLNQFLELARADSCLDALTSLANRRRFDQSLDEAVVEAARAACPLSLLMVDIDRFKRFNDTFGHQTGDAILRIVARTIRTNIKEEDMAARYGGEEFAVILPNTTLEAAVVQAEHIRRAVGTKKLVRKTTGQSLGHVTTSVGVATFHRSDTPEALVHRADACLYAAKRAGRNQVKSETCLARRQSGNAA